MSDNIEVSVFPHEACHLLSFIQAGGLQGLANMVNLPPAVAIVFLIRGILNFRSCSISKELSVESPSVT